MSKQGLKIAIMCADSAHHRFLISKMKENFNICSIIVEPLEEQKKMMFIKKKYKRYIYNMYQNVYRKIFGLNSYRKNYFKHDEKPDNRHIVSNINTSEVMDIIKEASPDLTVIMGTSILRQNLINCCGNNIINIHGGYLPYYRGNHCFFFAMLNNQFEKIGTSIHFVNAGIDTGDIIEVVVPEIYPNDNPEKLYCRAEKLAIERLVCLIKDYESGIPFTRIPQDKSAGKEYKIENRTPYYDFLYFFRRITRKMKVPRIERKIETKDENNCSNTEIAMMNKK